MANGSGTTGQDIDPTLKLGNERLREVFAWLSGERWTHDAIDGGHVRREIVAPTPSELASIANDLISTRTACECNEQTCKELFAELEQLEAR